TLEQENRNLLERNQAIEDKYQKVANFKTLMENYKQQILDLQTERTELLSEKNKYEYEYKHWRTEAEASKLDKSRDLETIQLLADRIKELELGEPLKLEEDEEKNDSYDIDQSINDSELSDALKGTTMTKLKLKILELERELTRLREGGMLYDVEYDDNLDSTFEQLTITDGKMLMVTPEDEYVPAIFSISHKESFDSPDVWFQCIMALPTDIASASQGILLFNKWTYDDVEVKDISLTDYIQIRNPVYLPHTAGRFSTKRFRKAQCPIVERLTNSLMMHGRNNGKKLMAVRIVKHAFEIIHLSTDQNPIQVLVDAIINTGPREDSTRIGSAGTVRRQAVDVSPLRRVNQSIALLTIGTRESAFRNVKSIAECLADELINAAKGSSNSYAIKKKDELERVAKSNR
ncbi:12059_t:CDS:2, partial [Entrophospora sp. SA101]